MTEQPTHPTISRIADLFNMAGDSIRGITISEKDKELLDSIVKKTESIFESVRVKPTPEARNVDEKDIPDLGGVGNVVFLNESRRTYIFPDRKVIFDGPYFMQHMVGGGHILRNMTGEEIHINPGWSVIRVSPAA